MRKPATLIRLSTVVLSILTLTMICQPLFADSGASGKPAYLGLLFRSLKDYSPDAKHQMNVPDSVVNGAVVQAVTSKSPAAAAGIQVNDILVKINDQSIDDAVDVGKIVDASSPRQVLNIDILRNGVTQTVNVTLAERTKDADKQFRMALWGASSDTPTDFTVPSSHGADVIGKAQALISDWWDVDSGMRVMKIQTVTDNIVETYTPEAINDIGFNVTRSVNTGGDEISVTALYYTGNLFSIHEDSKNALKRARLLSYILQEYDATLNTAPPTAETTAAALAPDSAGLSDEFQSYIKLITNQLAAGQYDTAISTIDALRSAVVDKRKESSEPAVSPSAPPAAPTTP